MLAFFDSMSGLVPCVIEPMPLTDKPWWPLHLGDGTEVLCRVRYTATRGPFKRGQSEVWPMRRIVPRSAVYRPRGAYFDRIAAYDWAQQF